MSEQYRIHTLESRLQHKKSIWNEINRILEMIESTLSCSGNLQDIEKAFAELDRQYKTFVSVHEECQELFKPEEEEKRGEEERLAQSVDQRIYVAKKTYIEARSQQDQMDYEPKRKPDQLDQKARETRDRNLEDEKKSSRSRSSKSKKSSKSRSRSSKSGSRSSSSSMRERALLERAKLEELKLEARYLQETKSLDQAKQQAELKAKQIVREAEIKELELRNQYQRAMVEAKLKVYWENGSVGQESIDLGDEVQGDYVEEYIASLADPNRDRSQSIVTTTHDQTYILLPPGSFCNSTTCDSSVSQSVSNAVVTSTSPQNLPVSSQFDDNPLNLLSEVCSLVNARTESPAPVTVSSTFSPGSNLDLSIDSISPDHSTPDPPVHSNFLPGYPSSDPPVHVNLSPVNSSSPLVHSTSDPFETVSVPNYVTSRTSHVSPIVCQSVRSGHRNTPEYQQPPTPYVHGQGFVHTPGTLQSNRPVPYLLDSSARPFVPGQAVPIQSVSVQSVPIQSGPGQSVPIKSVPSQSFPIQAVSSHSVPDQADQAKYVPNYTTRCYTTYSAKTTPSHVVQSQSPNTNVDNGVVQIMTNQMNYLTEMMGYLQAPHAKLDTFSGDPLEFEYFLATFIESVEMRISDPRSRLLRLLDCLTGEAKELVKGCVHLGYQKGYVRAMELLKKHFGDPYKVTSHYLKELRNWSKLRANDAESFRHFYAFLAKFESNMKCYRHTSYDSPELLQTVLRKIPPYMQSKWNRETLKIRRKGKEPKLRDLIEYIEDETTLINDPMFSYDALTQGSVKKSDTKPQKGSKCSFGIKVDRKVCPKCEVGTHQLDLCPQFKGLPVDERRSFLYRKRLCFACFAEGHSAKSCRKPKTCSMCQGKHATLLHGYQKPKRKERDKKEEPQPTVVTSTFISYACSSFSSVGLCVVPVKLRHASQEDKVVHTYALLDPGSNGSFIREDIADLFGSSINTSLSVKTLHGVKLKQCKLVDKLLVSSIKNDNYIDLPNMYSQDEFPVDINDVPTYQNVKRWSHLSSILCHLPQSLEDFEVGLLIGANCAKALEPLKVIPSRDEGPYAFESRLGWCVVGPINGSKRSSLTSHLVQSETSAEEMTCPSCHFFRYEERLKDNSLHEMLQVMYEHDFNERANADNESFSQDEKAFMKIMEENCKFINGKYRMPLPFREESKLYNNRHQAISRAHYLKKKLLNDAKMRSDYLTSMSKLFASGHAVYIDQSEDKPDDGTVWYIPHHGVYHPRKPDKLRVVFDCSARYKGVSLNDTLLQGPDLTNQLVGVLTRFRQDDVVIVGDIEKMFYQVNVDEKHQNYLRFLWWPNGDFNKELVECRMTVHLFGATSSPSVANFALHQTATDNGAKYDEEVSTILRKNFYVDDMLKATKTVSRAVNLLEGAQSLCSDGGFNLTQLGSNSRDVIESLPEEKRMKGMKDFDSSTPTLPVERVLGVSWCIENDVFNFRIVLKDKPLTRRGILSTVSSIYDPLGFAAPVMLSIKKLLQLLIKEKLGWDDEVPSETRSLYEKWRQQLPSLQSVEINRCFKPKSFCDVTDVSVHHFSDASTLGYGQCSFIRLEDAKGEVNVSFLMGKSRVSPLKPVTVPRLELTAAVTSTKVSSLLNKELEIIPRSIYYWTDSKIVLAYINNTQKAFHLYVANRVQAIRETTDANQWEHVASEDNPADIGSRGLMPKDLTNDCKWLNGPPFLKEKLTLLPSSYQYEIPPDDPEVKKPKKVLATSTKTNVIEELLKKTTSWMKAKRIVACMLRWRNKRRGLYTIEELEGAGTRIIKIVQSLTIDFEKLKKGDSLLQLQPFKDEEGVFRVGGRLKRSCLLEELKHPIILPKGHPLSRMILRLCHIKTAHSGRGLTINEVRTSGYWIIGISTLARSFITSCVLCRRFRGKQMQQKMADLPEDRLQPAPPFTYAAVDMFGPFVIKVRRTYVKMYVGLFTCLSSRAVHMESTASMETDAFILMLRRVIARRGNIRTMRSDNGTNFVGADNELTKALKELDHERINEFMQANGGEWLQWKRNPPKASHMGGVWERQIRSVRSILSSLLYTHGESLNDESFRTLLAEVEAILNSRPLTVENLNDPNSPLPLSPANLLTMKSKIIMPPPGVFQKADLYCRKHWRRVQHIANEFWTRWRKEYLSTLQSRTKWNEIKKNVKVGDVVIIDNETKHRNDWRLGRVIEVQRGDDGNVRSCKLKTSSGELVRPIAKLVLLVD